MWDTMGKIHLSISDEIEEKFRMRWLKKGYKKGNLTASVEEAMKMCTDKKQLS